MSEWRIYRKNVNLSNVTDATAYVASVKVLEYRGTFLEDTQVSFDISSPTPISLAYGDKLSYRGETYVLRDPLAVEKVARRNSYGGAFKYENIVFRGLEWEMQNVEFTDVVPHDNNLHYTGLSTFSFYCDHPQKLIERVQACMDIAYTGTEAWTISLASGFDISQYSFTPQTISISSGTSCWAALGILYKNWKIPFTRSGKTITVGASVVVTSTVEYGKGNGLMSIKRVPDTDVRVITRLRAYGSQKNMPYRYYNNKGFINEAMYMPYLMLPAVREHTAGDGHDVYLLSGNVENYGIIDGEVHFDGSGDNEEIYPTLEGMTTTDAEITAVTYDQTDKRLDRILSAQNPADNGVCADGNYDSDDAVDTDGVTIVKEFTMTIPYLGFDWKDKLTSEGQATIIMKSGMCAAREFTILEVNPVSASNPSQGSVLRMERINDDVTGYAYPNSTWTINAGDYFVIAGIEMDDVYVIAAENRLLTAASAFLAENDHPNYKYEPSIDNIWMQNHPTDAAKMRPGVKLSFSDTDLGISSGVVTIQTVTIDEGKRPLPEYQVVLNDNVTTTTLENLTAQVDAIMSGNAGVGGGMSQSELMAQIRNVGGTLFLSKNNADTASGLIRFLQGITSDGQARLNGGATFGTGNYGVTSAGDGTFDELSARLLSLVEGLSTTGTISAGTINTDVLNAKAAHFAQLIIDELRSAGGAYLLSAADCTIDYVEKLNSSKNVITTGTTAYYRCYYKANDDERAIAQKFVAGDQVMHTTYDAADVVDYSSDNGYYWMAVHEVSSEPVLKTLQDGKIYPCHWIDLDANNKSATSNTIPQVGDDAVLLGHQVASGATPTEEEKARQYAIYITAYSNSFDMEVQPPAIVFYQGVNDFTLSGKKPNYWGRDKVVITGNLKYSSSGSGTGTDVQDLINAGGASTTAVYQLETSRVVVKADGEGRTDEHVYLQVRKTQGNSTTYVEDKDFSFVITWGSGSSYTTTKTGYRVNLNPENIITYSTGSADSDADVVHGISSVKQLGWLFYAQDSFTITLKDGNTTLGVQTISLVKDGQDGQDGSGADQYAFYLVPDTQKVTCSGQRNSPSISPTSLPYTVKLEINGTETTATNYISRGTGVNCDVTVSGTTVTLSNLGKGDKTIGGSGTILCYTDTAKTKLWGVLTAKFNVSWSTFAFNIVDSELTSMADETDTDSLGYKIAQNRTSITQNTNSITAIAGGVDTSKVNLSTLKIQSDNISANVASQKYNSNLFGFSDNLSFTGNCKPFIMAYGIEVVGNEEYESDNIKYYSGSGGVSGFGGVSVKGLTISFSTRTQGGTVNATIRVAGVFSDSTTYKDITVENITNTWKDISFNVEGITALNAITISYPTSAYVSTIAFRNLKIETGSIATAFCISDADGTKIENDNLFTDTKNYDGDPRYKKIEGRSNENLDTSGNEGYDVVMPFYRGVNSDIDSTVADDGDLYIVQPDTEYAKPLTRGKVYTFSFMARSGTSAVTLKLLSKMLDVNGSSSAVNSGCSFTDYEEALFNGDPIYVHKLTTEWKRYYARFYVVNTINGCPSIQVSKNWTSAFYYGSQTKRLFYIADVRLEEGYIADESDPMSISGERTRSESKMTLTAQEFSVEVKNDLKKAGMAITIDGVRFVGSKVGFAGENGVEYISLGLDNKGIPYFIFRDAEGTPRYNLGYTGLADLINNSHAAEFESIFIYIRSLTLGLVTEYTASSFYNDASSSTTTNTAYQFHANFTLDAQGQKIYDPSSGEDLDGLYYSSNGISNLLPTGTKLANGETIYYMQKGVLKNKLVTGGIYRISNGVLTHKSTYTVEKWTDGSGEYYDMKIGDSDSWYDTINVNLLEELIAYPSE